MTKNPARVRDGSASIERADAQYAVRHGVFGSGGAATSNSSHRLVGTVRQPLNKLPKVLWTFPHSAHAPCGTTYVVRYAAQRPDGPPAPRRAGVCPPEARPSGRS